MARLLKKDVPLERRLRKLQSEQDLVAGDIRTISRLLKKGTIDLERRVQLRSSGAQLGLFGPAAKPDAKRAPGGKQGGGESAPSAGRSPGAGVIARGRPLDDDGLVPSSLRKTRNPRFSNYFSAGSIVAARPLRQEKSIQRNKAIFMVIFVAIVGFLVFRLLV